MFANKQIGTTDSLISGVTNIIEGFIEIDKTKPVAVYKAFAKLNSLTADENDILNTYSAFQKALTELLPGEQVQIITKTKPYNTNEKMKTFNSLVKKSKENEIEEDNYIKNKYPDYLKSWFEQFVGINNVCEYEFYILYSYLPVSFDTSKDSSKLFIKNKDFLNTNKQSFLSNIQRVCDIESLDTKDIKNLIEDCLNMDSSNNVGMNYSTSENMARSAVQVFRDHITVGDKYCKTVYISDFPGKRQNGFLQSLFLSGKQFRLSLFFQGISQEKVKHNLERQVKLANASANTGNIGNYASKEMLARYDELLGKYAAGQISFVNASLYLTLIEDSKEGIDDAFGTIKPLFSDLPLYKGDIEQLPLLKSTLPLNTNYAKHSYTVATDDASTAFPFYNFDIGPVENGIPIGTNITNQPVWYYPWSEDFTNGNCCILGIPGSGKSFFNNLVLINLGAWTPDIFIVDKSKSYEFLCKIQNGQYLTIDLEGKNCLNIFDCADYDPDLTDDNDINESGEVSANKIASIVGFFKTLLLTDSASEWQLDKSLIESVILQAYKQMEIKEGKVKQDTIPTLTDFQNSIEKIIKEKPDWKQQLSQIKEKLNPYVGKRQYAALTDRKTNIDIKSSFIVFDTSGLQDEEDIQSLAVYIISNFLTKKFKQNKKKHKRQILVIDETWALARFEAGIKFLLNLAKRSRHLGLMCMFASQQINDFLGNPDAAQVLKGAEIKFYFKQSKTDLDNLAALNDWNDQQKAIVGSLMQKKGEYSEAFMEMGKLGSNKIFVRPNEALYWISTSDPKRDVPIRDEILKSTNYNYELALQKLIEGA